jgi:hypothetical protein
MTDNFFDREFRANEVELLRGANRLPTISDRVRARVLSAAIASLRAARRWTQLREAASFLSVCLISSLLLSPVAMSPFPDSVWEAVTTRIDTLASDPPRLATSSITEPHSAWMLRREQKMSAATHVSVNSVSSCVSMPVARADSTEPRDALVMAFQRSDGWESVQAFNAIRSRSRNAIQQILSVN